MRLLNRGWLIATLALVSAGSAGRAQGILPHSKDVAGTIGFNSQSGVDGKMHPSYGVNGSWNLLGNLSAVGEFQYQIFGSTLAVRQTIPMLGGGFRYYFLTSPRIAPYVVATGGWASRGTGKVGTALNTADGGGYYTAGGGASLYLNESWGIRPEVRFQSELIGCRNPFKEVQGSMSIFYQFGGSSTPAKKK